MDAFLEILWRANSRLQVEGSAGLAAHEWFAFNITEGSVAAE
jgi:hypothetical protein